MPEETNEKLAKKEWLAELIESRISDYSVIEAGIAASRSTGSPFFPTVGQFIGYCHKATCERLGALETMAAYKHLIGYYALPRESREPCRLNPVVYHTMSDSSFDVFAFKDMSADKSVDYFSKHYRETMSFLASGGQMRAPVDTSMRIENPSGTTHGGKRTTQESARAHTDAMRKLIRGE
jgi:hypothetical protein